MDLRANITHLTPVARGLVGAYVVSGVIHLVKPKVFEGIVPKQLPRRRELVYVSGVAELACAAGMLTPRTREVAGAASAALLVAVFPANVEMARQAHSRITRRGSTPQREVQRALSVARLPLQWPLIRSSVAIARGGRG